MVKFETLVTVPKSLNSVWAGQGRLLRMDTHDNGTTMAIVFMLTGRCKGESGGFPLDHLKFKTAEVKFPRQPVRLVQEPEPFFHD